MKLKTRQVRIDVIGREEPYLSAPEREGSEQYNDFPKYIDYIFGKINANEPVGFYIDLDDYVTRMYFNSRMVASIGIVNLMEFV